MTFSRDDLICHRGESSQAHSSRRRKINTKQCNASQEPKQILTMQEVTQEPSDVPSALFTCLALAFVKNKIAVQSPGKNGESPRRLSAPSSSFPRRKGHESHQNLIFPSSPFLQQNLSEEIFISYCAWRFPATSCTPRAETQKMSEQAGSTSLPLQLSRVWIRGRDSPLCRPKAYP